MIKDNEVTLIHHKQRVRVSLHTQNDERTAIVRINSKDYPISIDLEDGKLKVCVWQLAYTDEPSDSLTLEGYL